MRLNTTCTCNACRNIPNLDLKFLVHFGIYVLQDMHALWEQARQRQDLNGDGVLLRAWRHTDAPGISSSLERRNLLAHQETAGTAIHASGTANSSAARDHPHRSQPSQLCRPACRPRQQRMRRAWADRIGTVDHLPGRIEQPERLTRVIQAAGIDQICR